MKKINSKTIAITVIMMSTIAMASCSLFEVSYAIDHQADFSQYHSFSWYNEGFDDSISGIFGVNTANLDSAIRSTIQQQLQHKGFSLSAPDSADLWINYQAIAQSTLSDRYRYSTEDISQSYTRKQIRYSSSFDASRRYTTAYDEGMFIVDIIDRAKMLLIWRGTVETPIGLYNNEPHDIKRMQKAVKKLLKKFPPQ
jgi:hypothetical protein